MVSLVLIGVFIGVYVSNEVTLQDDNPKQLVEENTLSMIIEQTAGSGDYKLETRSSWPTDGYVFKM